MLNIFAVKENLKNLHAFTRLMSLVASLRVCAEEDPRVKEMVESMPDYSKIYITTFPAKRTAVCEKVGNKLKLSLKKNVTVKEDAYVMFKSIDLAAPVLQNLMSVTDAFNQSRLVIKGDIELGIKVLKMFDIAQATYSTKLRRDKYLKEKPMSYNFSIKARFVLIFRGWL